jgi:uroporphyrinogen-III decarboxylase
MNPAMFDRFVWPYLVRYVDLLLEHDVIPILHLDSNWDRAIEKFKGLPKGKCIMSLDGKTDMRRAKQILGDHMCLLGDVPPEMMTFSTQGEVYDYTKKLIDDIGTRGLIIGCGCDMPPDAKKENVDAMVQAARDYKI